MNRTLILLMLLSFALSSQAAERTATSSIPCMTCAQCPVTVKAAIGKVAGVKSVKAEFARSHRRSFGERGVSRDACEREMAAPASTMTCPLCGHHAAETMPTDACQFFYDYRGCGAVLKPKPGDRCVFCSDGDVARPPVQETLLWSGAARGDTCCDWPKAVIR